MLILLWFSPVSEACSCTTCTGGANERYSTSIYEFANVGSGLQMSLSIGSSTYYALADGTGKASISIRNNEAYSTTYHNVVCPTYSFYFTGSVTDCTSSYSFDTTPTQLTDNVVFHASIYSGVSNTQHYGNFRCTLYVEYTNGVNAYAYITPQLGFISPTNMRCTFSFQFTEAGTYRLRTDILETTSSTSIPAATPLTVTILPPITSITIAPSAATATTGTLVTYTVNLYNNAALSTATITVTLSLDDSSAIGGDTSMTTSTGTATFSSSIQSLGQRTVTATVGSVTGTTTLTIIAHTFQVTALTASNAAPTTSNDVFTIVVTATDSTNPSAALPNILVTISLTAPNGGNSGLKFTVDTNTYSGGSFNDALVSGTKSWSNTKILSSGVFKLSVSYQTTPSTIQSFVSLTIENFIKSIALTQAYSVSNFVQFQLSIDLTGTDDNVYIGSRSLTVSESSLQGASAVTSASGKAVWSSVYFSSSGAKSLVVTSATGSDQFTTLTLTVAKSKLNLSFLTVTPTTSTSTFSVNVKVTESSQTTTLTAANGLTITLSLVAQGASTGTVLSGTASSSTSNGEVTFSNLKVLSSGSFKLQASTSSDLTSDLSSAFSVTNSLQSFTYSYPATISNFFTFSLVVTLLGDDNNNFDQSSTVTISKTSGTGNLGGTLSQTAVPTNGQITLSGLSLAVSGAYSIQIVVTSSAVTLTQTSTVTVAQSKIIVSFPSTTPSLSSDTFSVKVEVKDSTATNLESTLGVYPISLSLIGSSNSGLVKNGFPGSPQSTTGGQYTFTGLKIISSGSFNIQATSTSDIAQGLSSSFTITNKVIGITITTSPLPTPSNYCSFSLSFKLTGEDNLDYILPAAVTLFSNNNLFLTGASATLTPTSTGIITMTGISVKYNGNVGLYLSMYNQAVTSSTSIILVDKSKFEFSISAYPTKSTDVFNLQVSLMSNSGVVESNNGPYSIQLYISCKSQCSGTSLLSQGSTSTTISKTTVAGVASFNSISVLSSGDFVFVAQMDYIDNLESTKFTVANFVKTSYVSGPGSLPALSGYDMQVSLYGDDGNVYKLSTTITLTSTPSLTFDALTYSGSSLSIPMYFKLSGSYTIIASTTKDNPSGVTKSSYMASVTKPRLDVQVQGYIQDTSDTFDILVTLVDSYNYQIANKAPAVFSITASCGNCFDPAVSPTYSIIYKQTVLYKLKITSTGYNSLTVSGSDFISSTVSLSLLSSGVKAVALSNIPQEISINTYFTIKLAITNFENQPITTSAYFQLTDDFGTNLKSDYYTSSAASKDLIISIPKLTITSITVSCKGVKTTYSIKVVPLKLSLTLSPTPTKAGDLFNIVFSIINSLGSIENSNIASYYSTITLTAPAGGNSGLSVKNADTGSYNPLGVVVSNQYVPGIAYLYSLAIASSGSFVLTVTSNYAQTITPASLNLVIAPMVGSVVLNGPASPVVYKKYSITVNIYGVDGNAMKESLAVTLNDGGSFTGNSPITTTTGLATFTVYATQVISITYSASVVFNGVTTASTPASIAATVIKASLKAVFSPANVYMNTAFSMTVNIADGSGVLIPDIPSASITVSSSGSGFVTASGSTSQGSVQFSGLKFTTKGSLDIQMSSNTAALIDSGTVTAIVTSTLSSITSAYSTTSTSTNFDFTVTVSLKDSSGNAYTDTSSIAVTCSNDAASFVVSLISAGQYKLRFTASGSKTVVVTATSNGAEVKTTDTITISSNKLKFDSISLTSPSTSSTTFGLSVGIYDSTLTNKETTYGTYSITISIVAVTGVTNSGTTTSGTLTASASSGVATFSNLKILSSGTFNIKAVCSGFVDLLSESNYVITTGMLSYQITTTQSSARPYENIVIGFSLKGEDNALFKSSASFVPSPVPANTNGLSSPIQSSTGVFSITFYSTAVQSFNLQGSFTSGGQSLAISSLYISIYSTGLQFVFDPEPVSQRSVFSLTINIVNLSNQIITAFPTFTITIQLKNSNGAVFDTYATNMDITSGTGKVSNKQITQAGSYFIYVTTNNVLIPSYSSNYFTITQAPSSLTATASVSSISSYFYFAITITLYSSSTQQFTNSYYYISISDDSSSIQGDTYIGYPGFPTVANVYFKTDGSKKVKVLASYMESNLAVIIPIVVTKSVLFVSLVSSTTNFMANNYFQYSLQVKDSALTKNPTMTIYDITVKLTSSDASVNNLPSFTNNNVYTYGTGVTTSGYVSTSGTYKILASGPGLENAYSAEFTAGGSFSILNLVSNIASPTINDDVQITVTLTDYNGRLYNLAVDVILYSTSSNYITGLGTKTITTGTAVFNLKFSTANQYYINVAASTLTKYIYLVVSDPPRLIMTANTNPLVSATIFTVNIQAKILDAVSGVRVTLQLICQENAVCSGNKLNKQLDSLDTVNGFVQYSNLQIYSSGSFYLKATSPGYQAAQIVLTDFKNDVKSFITTQTSNPTVNFKNSIPYSIIGLDDLPFIIPITVTLSDANKNEFGGDKVLTLTKSTFNLAIQFWSPVAYDIVLSVSNSLIVHHLKFDVKPMLVKFIDPPALSYGLGSTVPISLSVYDYTGTVLETQGQYSFEVLVTPPQIFTPNVIKVTSGKGSISSLFAFPGLFSFSLTPSIKYTVSPGSSILVYDTVYKIVYNSQDLKQISSQLFLFNITLLNANGKPFNYSNSITFKCTDDSGRSVDTPIKTINATPSLPLYFLSEGTKLCTITPLNGTSIDLTFVVDPPIRNPDEKCAAAISNDVCGKCVPQAILKDGKCSCIQYSKFNSDTKACECEAGLSVNNGICSVCGNYFKSSELSAYYSQDFKSIIIDFARPVNQNLVVDCNEYITLPDTLRMYTFACSWSNANKLEIQFNRVIPTPDSAININPRYIQAVGNLCLFDVVYLTVSAKVIYEKPVPVAKIEGVTSVSLKCNTDGVTVKSKFETPDYLYQWSVQSTSQALTDYVNSQQSAILTIAPNLLVAGAIKISLKVTSSLYQTSATDVFTVNVLNNEALSVSITAGSILSVRPSESVTLKASVDESCGSNGPYSYKWTHSTSPSDGGFNFATMTNKDKNLMTLSIQGNSMRKGISYTFKVTVVKGNLSGTASIVINVVSADLVVSIGRSSGTVGTQTDLLIPVNVIDPDNECKKTDISWIWACTQDGNQCSDSSGNNLIVQTDSIDLLIQKSKLADGAFYHFSLSVSCKYKVNAAIESVDIEIDSEKNGDIKLRDLYEIRSNEDLIIIPQLISIDTPKFLWTVYPLVSGLDVSKATLYFPPNVLTPGITYRATLTMYSKSIDDGISAYTDVLVKDIPKCQKLTITSVAGGKFAYKVIGCENDDPTNQIRFSFGYTHEDYIVWVTKFISQNSISLLIKDKKGKGVAKVCYSDNSCTIFTTKFPKSTFRSLSVDQSLLSDDNYDPDYFASLLIFYSADITTSEDFTSFYNQYLEFFLNAAVDEQVFDIFLDSTIALFTNPYALTRSNSEELANADNILVNLLQNYTELITDVQIKKVLDILELEIDKRDSKIAMKILELISKINFLNKPLGYEISMHSSKISVFRNRNLASEFLNKTFSYRSDDIIIADLPLNNEGVFDLFYAKYLQSDTNFDLSFYQIGSYNSINYNRSDTETLVSFALADSISFTVAGSFNTDKIYKCVYFEGNQWVSGGCNIESISKTHATVTLNHLSSFRIEIEDNCGVGTGPIATMILLVGIIVTFGIMLHLYDKKEKSTKVDPNQILIYYPLTSLYFYQPNSRRAIILFQLLSSELLILTLIGAFHYHFDSPEKDTENEFSNYYGKQLSRGAAGWALAQVFIIPIFWLNVIAINRKAIRVITVSIMTVVTLGCIIGVSIMGAEYCGGWSEYWIINFLIFLGFDLATTELFYALLLYYVYKKPKDAYEFTAVRAIQIESVENPEKVMIPSHESVNLQPDPSVDGGAASSNRSKSNIIMEVNELQPDRSINGATASNNRKNSHVIMEINEIE